MKNKLLLFVSAIILLFIFSKESYAQYVTNYAINFNTANSYIAIPNSAELNPTTAITIEAWVYPRNLDCVTFVGKNWPSSYWFGSCNGQKIRFYPDGGHMVDGNAQIPLNKWTHIAATYDGNTTRLYINGVLDFSSNVGSFPLKNSTDSVRIGKDNGGWQYSGYMDNVRIWNVARTQQQIQNTMYIPLQIKNPSGNYAGLVGAWLLDGTAEERSGAVNNNGVLRNVGFVYTENKPMNHYDFNNALSLDGNSYVVAPNENDFNATTAITVEAWIKRDLSGSQPAGQFIVSQANNSGGVNYSLYLGGSNLQFLINDGAVYLNKNNAIADDSWHHVAATYNSVDGATILYLDGVNVAQSSSSTKPLIRFSISDSLYIGGLPLNNPDASKKFKGLIDEVRIWKNVVRTESLIKAAMYTSRNDTNGPSESCSFSFDNFTNFMMGNASGFSNGFQFRGNALITSAKLQNRHSSPIISTVVANTLIEYIMRTNRTTITQGTTTVDSVYFNGTGNLQVTNVKAVVLLSHESIGSVRLSLVSPTGTVVNLTPNTFVLNNSRDLITIFDQSADSTINYTNFGLAPFSPKVKPFENLNSFVGGAAIGWWKLRITDVSTGSMLRVLNGWGIRITYLNMQQYSVTTSSNPTAGGGTSGGGTFNQGTLVTVTAVPNLNYSFVNWTEGTTVVSTNSSYAFVLNGNRNLVANFSLNQFTITLSANPTAGGTVSGGGTYNSGQNITVTAIPNNGYQFVNWTEGSTIVSTNTNYSFTVSGNRTLVANFSIIPILLVNPDFRTVTMTAGTTTFSVSNTAGGTMNWTASSNSVWATITSGSSGTNSGTINISYQANSGVARTATITVTSTGATGSPKSVEVRQDQYTDVRDLDLGIPETYELSQNYPNPFNPTTIIRYGIPKDCFVKITVYNSIGKEVEVLISRYQGAGYYEVTFNATKYSSGIYFYKIMAENFSQTKKLLLIK